MAPREKPSFRCPGALACVGAIAALLLLALTIGPLSADAPPTLRELPRTDGEGLPPPRAAIGPLEWPRLIAESRRACEGPCATPFGQVLGVADGAAARSNCVSTCLHPERSFLDLETGEVAVSRDAPAGGAKHYVGITYQCVGYARLWWMKSRSLTFGDVEIAHDILYLTEATDPRTGAIVPLGRSLNGTARRPPERGDLLVYLADREDPEWRAGHVAVVVDVDREQGLVALAEENYDNRPWEDPQAFARRIEMFEINGRFTLLDVAPNSRTSADGGRIGGWVYPVH
ncbi:CHAP domain-containing protein [Thiocapsa marina]|uniref:CHAP domain containing protein n=1 Tax=Thiocapsa marina 5811 TaxID=768671 RepID=F9UCS5_9GAMM|nr:CHAP domain-containing protein [Thiocapsa marina]EGV18188.1 CHAP domain containing protein [Thiocapsa marina 5811]